MRLSIPLQAGLQLALFAAVSVASAQNQIVPSTINHQGVVRVSGVPFKGTGEFRFAIVMPSDPSGVNYWTNDGTALGTTNTPTNAVSLDVVNGLYHVNLGDTDLIMVPITADIFAQMHDAALRVWFDDGDNGMKLLVPDRPLTSVPFAFQAERAATALGVSLGAVDSAGIQNGSVTANDLEDGAALDEILDDDGTGSGLDADTIDGQHASAFAVSVHNHDIASLNGTLASGQVPDEITVDRVTYTTPRTHHYGVVGAAWTPKFHDTEYTLAVSNCGIRSNAMGIYGTFIAPLYLPDGAVIQSMTVWFYKDATHTSDIEVNMYRYVPSSSVQLMAVVDTVGLEGKDTRTDDTVNPAYSTVDNSAYGYELFADCTDWGDGKLLLYFVSIEYTLNEAP